MCVRVVTIPSLTSVVLIPHAAAVGCRHHQSAATPLHLTHQCTVLRGPRNAAPGPPPSTASPPPPPLSPPGTPLAVAAADAASAPAPPRPAACAPPGTLTDGCRPSERCCCSCACCSRFCHICSRGLSLKPCSSRCARFAGGPPSAPPLLAAGPSPGRAAPAAAAASAACEAHTRACTPVGSRTPATQLPACKRLAASRSSEPTHLPVARGAGAVLPPAARAPGLQQRPLLLLLPDLVGQQRLAAGAWQGGGRGGRQGGRRLEALQLLLEAPPLRQAPLPVQLQPRRLRERSGNAPQQQAPASASQGRTNTTHRRPVLLLSTGGAAAAGAGARASEREELREEPAHLCPPGGLQHEHRLLGRHCPQHHLPEGLTQPRAPPAAPPRPLDARRRPVQRQQRRPGTPLRAAPPRRLQRHRRPVLRQRVRVQRARRPRPPRRLQQCRRRLPAR